jgi:hypothetical protein
MGHPSLEPLFGKEYRRFETLGEEIFYAVRR